VYQTILQNRLSAAIPERVPAALIGAGLPAESIPAMIGALLSGSPDALGAVPGVTPEAIQAGAAAVQSCYSTRFYIAIIGGPDPRFPEYGFEGLLAFRPPCTQLTA
jgi:hypothetical protein